MLPFFFYTLSHLLLENPSKFLFSVSFPYFTPHVVFKTSCMTMVKITKVKSRLTQWKLDDLCRLCHIPSFVHPLLLGPDQTINQYPPGKIGLYSDFLIMLTFVCHSLFSLLKL